MKARPLLILLGQFVLQIIKYINNKCVNAFIYYCNRQKSVKVLNKILLEGPHDGRGLGTLGSKFGRTNLSKICTTSLTTVLATEIVWDLKKNNIKEMTEIQNEFNKVKAIETMLQILQTCIILK